MLVGMWWLSYVALWGLVVVEALVVVALARQVSLVERRHGPVGARMGNVGLELGDNAPRFEEEDLGGRLITLGAEHNRPTLLIFFSPGCSACAGLGPAVRTLYRHERKDLDVVLVSLLNDEAENRAYIREHRLESIPLLRSPRVAEAYHVATAPYAILVDHLGKIHTKGVVNSLEHLESLLNALDEGFPSFDSKVNTLVANDESRSG